MTEVFRVTDEKCVQLLTSRCSVRKFKDIPVPDEHVRRIVEIGTRAPSAGNKQPWRVVAVRDPDTICKLAVAAHDQTFITTSNVVLAVIAVPEESAARYGERGATLYALQDTAALTYAMLLAAHFMGYAACWVGAFDEKSVSDILRVPKTCRPVAMIPIGIPDETPKPRARRPITEVLVSEHFP